MSFPATPLAIFNFSGPELVLILLILLLLFGGSKLPSLARGLGQSIREFKKASSEEPEPANKAAAENTTAQTTEAKKPGNGTPSHGTN